MLGRCFCDPEWEGRDCGRQVVRPCPLGDCGPHGECHLGQCSCAPGWEGEACQKGIERRCPKACHGNGVCMAPTYDKCVCAPGFFGTSCQQVGRDVCVPTCDATHGHCIFGECFCDKGWGSKNCSLSLAKTPALPGPQAGGNSSSLREGLMDETRFKQDEVSVVVDSTSLATAGAGTAGHCPQQCSGRGECFNATGKCYCFPGFQGPACEKPVRCTTDDEKEMGAGEDGCGPHGLCFGGGCVCDPGWSGPHCASLLEGAGCVQNCSGNGICQHGRCWCDHPFVGPACADALCSDNCNNRGICHNGECYCVDGFTGPSCVPVAEAAAEAQQRAIVAEHAKSQKINAESITLSRLSRSGGRGIGMSLAVQVTLAFLGISFCGVLVFASCKAWRRSQQQSKNKLLIESELGEASTAAVAFLG